MDPVALEQLDEDDGNEAHDDIEASDLVKRQRLDMKTICEEHEDRTTIDSFNVACLGDRREHECVERTQILMRSHSRK